VPVDDLRGEERNGRGRLVDLAHEPARHRARGDGLLPAGEGDPGYVDASYSGVYVYAPSNTVKQRDRVTLLSATVSSYNGQIQLTVPNVQVVTSEGEAAPEPELVLPADVATGGSRAAALESVLVQVSGVTVTDTAPPPGAGDKTPTNEFVVDGKLPRERLPLPDHAAAGALGGVSRGSPASSTSATATRSSSRATPATSSSARRSSRPLGRR
jgi:hypothetical protein